MKETGRKKLQRATERQGCGACDWGRGMVSERETDRQTDRLERETGGEKKGRGGTKTSMQETIKVKGVERKG